MSIATREVVTTPQSSPAPETFPYITQGAGDDWQLFEGLLIGSRSRCEADEAKTLFPESLIDEVLGEWAADGRYEWLQQHEATLPDTLPAKPNQSGYSAAERLLMYRLIYCQSKAEASAIKSELVAINPDFRSRYWLALSEAERQSITHACSKHA